MAAAALGRTLAEFEERLSAVNVSLSVPPDPVGQRASVVVFDARGALAQVGVAVPY